MSSFTTPLLLEYLDGKNWKLHQAFEYHIGQYPAPIDQIVTVPVGFITNFVSIPRPLWAILPPTGKYGKAAVIHDYLYAIHCINGRHISRKEADLIFLEAMKVLGVPAWKRRAMYRAVRIFGTRPYLNY